MGAAEPVRLRRLALALTRGGHGAEDLVQDPHAHGHGLGAGRRAGPLAHATTVMTRLARLARRGRARDALGQVLLRDRARERTATGDDLDERLALRAGVRALPPGSGHWVVLRYLCDRSVVDIAAASAAPPAP